MVYEPTHASGQRQHRECRKEAPPEAGLLLARTRQSSQHIHDEKPRAEGQYHRHPLPRGLSKNNGFHPLRQLVDQLGRNPGSAFRDYFRVKVSQRAGLVREAPRLVIVVVSPVDGARGDQILALSRSFFDALDGNFGSRDLPSSRLAGGQCAHGRRIRDRFGLRQRYLVEHLIEQNGRFNRQSSRLCRWQIAVIQGAQHARHRSLIDDLGQPELVVGTIGAIEIVSERLQRGPGTRRVRRLQRTDELFRRHHRGRDDQRQHHQ